MDSTIQKLDEKMECPDTLEALPGFIITSVQPHRIDEVSIYFEKGMIGDPEFKVCLMTSGNHYFDHASGNFYRGYPGLDSLKLKADSFTRDRRRYLEDGFCNSCRTTLENVLDIDLSWTAMS